MADLGAGREERGHKAPRSVYNPSSHYNSSSHTFVSYVCCDPIVVIEADVAESRTESTQVDNTSPHTPVT